MFEPKSIQSTIYRIFKPVKLNNGLREWLYDILSLQASLGNISNLLPGMIDALEVYPTKNEKKIEILTDIQLHGSRSGQTIADSLKKYIPEDEYNLISASEASSELVNGLNKASNRLKQKIKHKRAISGVTNQLIIRFCMVIGIIWVLGKVLFAPLTRISAPETWPDLAQNVYFISSTVEVWLPMLLFFIAASYFWIRWSLKHMQNGPFRNFCMNYLQPWGLHRDLMAMTTLDSFITLSVSKSEHSAIGEFIRTTDSKWLLQCYRQMLKQNTLGNQDSLANNPLIPPELNDALNAMGSGAEKERFFTVAIERLNIKIDEKMKNIEAAIGAIGTISVYAALAPMIMSYFMVSLSAVN